MKQSWTLLVTLRYLWGKGPSRSGGLRRVLGGMVGIALSLVPLVLVYQLADGMIQGISARYLETGTFHLQARYSGSVVVADEGNGSGTWEGALKHLRSIGGVTWASEEVQGVLLANGNASSLGLAVRGVDPALADEPGFRSHITMVEGTFDLSDSRSVVLGREAARVLGVGAGDTLRLMSVRTDTSAFMPKIARLKVAGVVSTGYQELDRLWCFMDISRARSLIPPESAEHFIALKVRDPFGLPNPLLQTVEEGKAGILDDLGGVLGFGWTLRTWFELQRYEYLNFVTTRNLLLFIMVLIVLIASVNVSSSMIMLVLEKQHEIAVLKSTGAGPGGIVMIFLGAGGVSGALGALAGLSAGSVLSLFINELIHALESVWNFLGRALWAVVAPGTPWDDLVVFNPAYYLERIPIQLHPDVLGGIFLLTLALSLVASLFPARRAARMRPLDIMRRV